jgi:hypothetical protein
MEIKVFMVVILLLALTNIYTVHLALTAGRKAEARLVTEFYRGFYAARLLAHPRRFNYIRLLTHLALADQVHLINLPGWRWPLPRAYNGGKYHVQTRTNCSFRRSARY